MPKSRKIKQALDVVQINLFKKALPFPYRLHIYANNCFFYVFISTKCDLNAPP
jgi:hypothetical protein